MKGASKTPPWRSLEQNCGLPQAKYYITMMVVVKQNMLGD
jgi:hypothetical protein